MNAKSSTTSLFYRAAAIVMIAMLALAAMPVTPALAATKTSTGAGGNWNTAATWSPNGVPVAGDAVVIAAGSPVTIDVSVTQTAAGSVTVNSGATLTANTTGTTHTFGALTILGTGTFTITRQITVLGATNITGTINLNPSATRANVFTGDVTLNSGAVWSETLNPSTFDFQGNFTNNATTFTAFTGVHTFSGAAKTISGSTTTSIGSVAVTGTYTNSGTLTVGTALSGAGSLANSGTLNIGGTSSIAVANLTNTGTINVSGAGAITGITNNAAGIVNESGTGTVTSFNNATATSTLNISTTPTVPTFTTLTVSAAGNTVNYNGAGNQTVKAVAYSKLIFSGTGAKSMLTGTSAGSNLSIAPTGSATASIGAGLTLTVNSLTLGGLGRIGGVNSWGSTSSTATNQNNTYFAATTGRLTVTTDTRTASSVTLSPTGTAITYGAALSTSTLSGGTGSPAGGTFTFTTPATIPAFGATTAGVTYTPTDLTSYTTSTGTGNITVSPRPVTLSGSRAYDTTTTAAAAILSVSNIVAPDTVTVASGSGTLASANAGAQSITSLGDLALGGTDAAKYTLTGATGSVTISKIAPTASVTAPLAVDYDGSTHAATASCLGGGAASNILTGGAANQTDAGTYAVTVDCAASTNYNAAAGLAAGNFDINKIAPTASVTAPLAVDYDGSTHAATASCSGGGTASNILTGGAATQTDAGTYAVTVDCAASTNYNAAAAVAAGNFDINKIAPTASVTAPLAVDYDGSTHAATASCSGGGTASNILTGGAATQTDAGTYAVTVDCAASANYNAAAAVAAGNFDINKIAPTASVTAPLAVDYDGSTHAATASCLGGGTASNILTGGAANQTDAGTYAVTVDCAASTNYNAAAGLAAGNFDINKIAPTASVTAPLAVDYDGSTHAATASCSGGGAASNILTGGAATQTDAGTYAVLVDCAASTNYNAAAVVAAGNFDINKIAPTASVTNTPQTFTGSPMSATVACLGGGAASNILTGGAATQTAVGTYAVTADCAASTNYNAAAGVAAGNFVINNKLSQTISFGALADKTYGAADFTVSATATSTLAVDFASQTSGVCTVSGSTVHLVAVGTCTVRASQLGDGSYNAAPDVDQSFAVNQAVLTVTADSKSINVGDADPAFTFVYSGFVNGEGANALTTAPSCSVSGAHSAAGSYAIVCSGGAATNYSFTYVNGTLTVNAVNPVAIFADVPFTYWANSFIERLYNAGITGGCSAVPLNYCPDASVTRAQMAIFLLRGIHGSSYSPPAVGSDTGFTDVAVGSFADAWIKQLAAEGITGGCGVGLYCPNTAVTRAQMAIFLLRSEHGSSYAPPTGTGIFTDVPSSNFAFDWIEQLSAEGITSGCGTGLYCPNNPVTRAQMAVFLVKTFNLP